jgi:predicted phosphate transport protein (TIGR00153 family)
MGFSLIPKEEKYFVWLHEMAAKVKDGGELFVKLVRDYDNRVKYAEQIKGVEVACDELTMTITQKLNSSFITPLDREDIFLLVKELDDVIDLINETARNIDIYDIPAPKPNVSEFAELIAEATSKLADAFAQLEKHEALTKDLKAIYDLEKRGDTLYTNSIRTLFKEEKDPISLIKWKAIYEELENTLDRCKDVAEALEAVVVKNK